MGGITDFLSGGVEQGRAVRLLESMIESSPVGTVLVAPDSHLLVFANEAAAQMWGVHHPTALADGKREIHDLVPDAVQPRHRDLVDEWFKHPRRLLISRRAPIPGKRLDNGETFMTRIQLAPIYVGPGLAFLPNSEEIQEGTYAAAYIILVEEWGG